MSQVIDFLDDNHIPYMTSGNHHCRAGWVQVCCPFCFGGDSNYHLGINIEEGYCNCYKCGFHTTVAVFSALLGTKRLDTKNIVRRLFHGKAENQDLKHVSLRAKDVKLPGKGLMYLQAYEYLTRRFFDETDNVINTYKLTSTNWDDSYETVDAQCHYYTSSKYANCIVIPNYLQSQLVSFQCNNYLKRQYITASKTEELIPCKSFLWGVDLVPADTVIVCEAAYDAMSIGAGAVHTHGCCFTREQVQELATFGEVYVAYDMDKAGEVAAHQLVNQLSHRTNVHRIHFSSGKDLNELLKTPQGKEELNEIKELLR
jgi:hypothetical protein